ncbi:MAG: Hpt domain-containing protein [Oscillospiraceae bacterium]|nr:Hpt domain-containing protein [Oscillospiraceae bacterium]
MTIQELYDSIGGSYESAKRIMQMDKLIGKLIVKFLDEKSFARLTEAWDARDASGVFESAHAMKGVCANLGLNGLSQQASDLAEEFRPGHTRAMDDAEVNSRVAALKTDYDKTIEGIRAFSAQ